MSQNPLNQPRRTEVHDVPHYQHPNALCFLHFSRGAAPGSLLEEFHNAFHERMRRKMQMANAEPQKCVTEKNLQACVSTPSSGIAPSSISIECGKPDVFSGMAQSFSSWPGSMRGGSDPRHGKVAHDVKTCGHAQAGKNSPGIHQHGTLGQYGKLEQRPGWPAYNQGMPNKEVETPDSSMDGGGAGCVETVQCTPIGEVNRPTPSAFGLQDDSFTQAGARCQRCIVGSDPKKPSRGPVGCDCGATAVTVIQDPFSANKRRLLTVDTALYLAWVRSSTIVNDSRQETDDLGIFKSYPGSHLRTCADFPQGRASRIFCRAGVCPDEYVECLRKAFFVGSASLG